MATKLTKAARTAICEAVLKATTLEAQEATLTLKFREEMQAMIEAKVPVGLLQLARDKQYDRTWFKWQTCVHFGWDEAKRPIPSGYTVELLKSVPYGVGEFKLTPEELADTMHYNDEINALYEMRGSMRTELMGFLSSCSTVEKALAGMPELEPYIPKNTMFYPPVASTANLLSSLTKAGFVVQPASHV